MASNNKYTIDLEAVSLSGKPMLIKAEDDMFASLDESEISGGQLDIEARVKKAGNTAYTISYTISGTVKVPCDRCLDDIVYPISTTGDMKLYENEEDAPDDGESRVIGRGTVAYDPSWDIYELAELALPLQRVHEEGGCNPDMLAIIEAHKPEAELPEEDEEY